MKVRDGKYRYKAHIKESLYLHKAMYTHSGGLQRVFLFDSDNQLFGCLDSLGQMRGFNLGLLNIEKLKFNNGQVTSKTPVKIVLLNSKEIDVDGVLVAADFLNDTERLTDVDITVPSGAAAPTLTTFRMLVAASGDGTPISGLLLADFIITHVATGAVEVPTSVTEPNADGVYLIVKSTNFTSGAKKVTLRAPALLTVKAYEVALAGSVTIP
jgi:hypothetical protein